MLISDAIGLASCFAKSSWLCAWPSVEAQANPTTEINTNRGQVLCMLGDGSPFRRFAHCSTEFYAYGADPEARPPLSVSRRYRNAVEYQMGNIMMNFRTSVIGTRQKLSNLPAPSSLP